MFTQNSSFLPNFHIITSVLLVLDDTFSNWCKYTPYFYTLTFVILDNKHG